MKPTRLIIFLIFAYSSAWAQHQFSGYLADSTANKTVYLSIIEDYRKTSRTYLDQIIQKSETDTTGFFSFNGDYLPSENRIYSLHVDNCSEAKENKHYLGGCENSERVLFIANKNDTIYFPTTFDNEIFCNITSTNAASSQLLDINLLKEEMIFDFSNYSSPANKQLNLKKWFHKLHSFAQGLDEPLAELYAFEFLSDRRNETYEYYLKDVQDNPYYDSLSDRLREKYPSARFTQLYASDILMDKQLGNSKESADFDWKWILAALLFISVISNLYLISKKMQRAKKQQQTTLGKLTNQEQKIVEYILADKTNKEIAATLFISVSTVKTHINNLYKKLNLTNREDIKKMFS
ncbi:response regulator transcription factor [Maribacter sp. 2210JD10-5]|uniref:response regulator transcription factor n=1 Tax=Maribacter sp. 2210JD10-5 TaxID=3386272 RepID=UPI0039BD5A66